MQIDWITVAAQIVNFLVLAWLLHRFLYGPITRAMERREQRIAQRLGDAEQKRKEAENEANTFRRQQEELEKHRARFLTDAQEIAEEDSKRLQQEARDEIEALKMGWLNGLEQQKAEFRHGIRQRAQEHFYELAKRALGDLADAELEEQMSRVFCKKLGTLEPETKTIIVDASRRTGNGAIVRSRFELSSGAKHQITNTIHNNILEDAEVTYEQNPGLICGFDLKIGGQTVAWNIDHYVETLENLIEKQDEETSARAD